MSQPAACVLDASALLAYLRGEPGAVAVEEALMGGASISAANWAETLSKMADLGYDPNAVSDDLARQGILHETLAIRPLDEAAAAEIARLRPLTRPAGLSLGDRACLALGIALGVPVLTAERAWPSLGVGVTVVLIR